MSHSDFGDAYPNVEVTGTDLSLIQPSWIPPNVKFEIDDANLDWTWNDNNFDFIHVRFLAGNIADWSRFYREAFRCCKPGGWIEHQDPSFVWYSDRGIPEDSALDQFPKVFWAGGEKFGRSFRVVDDGLQKKGMEEAGFVDVVVKDLHVPVGDWPKDPHQKELGTFAQVSLLSDIEGKFYCSTFQFSNETGHANSHAPIQDIWSTCSTWSWAGPRRKPRCTVRISGANCATRSCVPISLGALCTRGNQNEIMHHWAGNKI